jgi:hypothetical protein
VLAGWSVRESRAAARQKTSLCTASARRTGGSWVKRGCNKKTTSIARRLVLPVYCPAACACPADPAHEPDLADRSTAPRSSRACPSRLLAARLSAAEHPFADRLFPPLSPRVSLTCRSSPHYAMFASTSTAAPSRPSRSPRRRSPLARAARTALALAVAGTAISAVNGAMYEPPEGQVMLGFWFDPANRKSARSAAPSSRVSRACPSTTHRRHRKTERATGRRTASRSFARVMVQAALAYSASSSSLSTVMALHARSPRQRAQAPTNAGFTGVPDLRFQNATRAWRRAGGPSYRRAKSQQD